VTLRPRPRVRLALLLYSAAAVAYVVDRVTKLIVESHLEGRPPIDVIPGVVRLRFTTNTGGAFGLFGGQTWLFFGATALVCAAIVVVSWSLQSRVSAVGLGLVLGGALGNMTDRILRGPRGVVDFIDFRVWPVFNAADSAIVIGALIVAVAGLRRRV
jgi:signal peptidase II